MDNNKPVELSYKWIYKQYSHTDIEKNKEYLNYKPFHYYKDEGFFDLEIQSWTKLKKILGDYNDYSFKEAKYYYDKCILRLASKIGFVDDNKINPEFVLNTRDSIVRLYDFFNNPNNNNFFVINGLNKDKEIKEIVKYLFSDHISKFITEGEIQIINSFSFLFLRRYNLDGVKEIELKDGGKKKSILNRIFPKIIITEKNNIENLLLIILPFLIIFSSISIFNSNNCAYFNLKIFPITFIKGFEYIDNDTNKNTPFPIKYNTPEVFVETLIIIFGILLITYLYKNPGTIKLLMPRLIAGIIIGYLPIIVGDETWKFAIFSHSFTVFIIIIFSFILSFIYLWYEIMNIIGHRNTKEVFKRTLNVFSKGVIYSFSIGIIILDILNAQFIENMNNIEVFQNSHLHCGLIGIIDPKVLLVFFPLALLIGIFVQIIWEDKPITEPI